MTLAIILIVVLAVGFLVAIRIVGINHGEKNPEEDCGEDEVMSMSAREIMKLSREDRKLLLEKAAKNAKDDYEKDEDEVILSEEEKDKIKITRCDAFLVDTGDLSPNKARAIVEKMRRAYKNCKLDFNDDFLTIEDDADGVLIFPVGKGREVRFRK